MNLVSPMIVMMMMKIILIKKNYAFLPIDDYITYDQ